MGFLERLLAGLSNESAAVHGLWIGPYWTVVQTERGVGLATTRLGSGPTHGEQAQRLAGAGQWVGRSAADLARGVLASHPLERSVGLAALNALLPEPTGRIGERNAGELASERGAGQIIGVVGWFPFIPELNRAAARVEIFEKDPETGFELTAERARRLGECDGLCITAATLLNGTLDGILRAARPEAWKILVGPSAPLCRATLELGFAAVCGARVTDLPAVVRVVQEGGCFQQIRRGGGVRLLTLEA